MEIRKVYLLLGGNLGDTLLTFAKARQALADAVGPVVAASSVFASPAWGFESEHEFRNQVLCVDTFRDPFALLREVLRIETELGRVRDRSAGSDPESKCREGRYASRVIDIDILFYENAVIRTRELVIPHPLMQRRAFTMLPLRQIASGFVHPVLNKTVRELCDACPGKEQVRMLDLPENRVYSYVRKEAGSVPVGNVSELSAFDFRASGGPLPDMPVASAGEAGGDASAGSSFLNLNEEKIAEWIGMGFPPSFRFMTVEGNIGVGKTSLSRKIAAQFGAKLVQERFEDNVFLPKFYQDRERFGFPLELSFLVERYRQAKEDFVQELFHPFIVSDFSLGKSLIFARNNLTDEEYDLYSRLYHIILSVIPRPDLYVYLHADVPHLLGNIRKRGRSYEENMDPDYLESIEKGYFEYVRLLPESRFLLLDVRGMDFVGNPEDYRRILARIIEAAHRAVMGKETGRPGSGRP